MSQEDLDSAALSAAQNFDVAPGVASPQRSSAALPVLVAPTATTDFNTLRPFVRPVACWRLSHALFEFDSSVVLPGVRDSSPRFAASVAAHPQALASVFGHADPTGTDEINKVLSGRRAKAVFGMLVRDPDVWEQLFRAPAVGDSWGTRALKRMLATVVDPASDSNAPYYDGPMDSVPSGQLLAAVRRFQGDHDLAVDGVAGVHTRRALFLAYMDAICVDEAGAPFVMRREMFLDRGADPDGKGAYQGCGEANPVRVFSAQDQARFDAGVDREERDARNATNRRAMVFLFAAPLPFSADEWPCPRAEEGASGCRAMFWPDARERLSPGDEEREYRTDRRTMACSFYDRFARRSPCEGVPPPRTDVLYVEWTDALTPFLPEGLSIVVRLGTGARFEAAWTDGVVTPAGMRRFQFDEIPSRTRCSLSARIGDDEIALWIRQIVDDPESPPVMLRALQELANGPLFEDLPDSNLGSLGDADPKHLGRED